MNIAPAPSRYLAQNVGTGIALTSLGMLAAFPELTPYNAADSLVGMQQGLHTACALTAMTGLIAFAIALLMPRVQRLTRAVGYLVSTVALFELLGVFSIYASSGVAQVMKYLIAF